MNTAITAQKASEIMEAVLARGDLSQLNAHERSTYVVRICESLGLNPMTQPIQIINLSGRLVPYVRKDGTDQLRKIHGVSVTEISTKERDGVYTVIAKVTDSDGRTDMATGAVHIAGLNGENLCNAVMRAETKAKRRATLSICGLGFLDESELPAVAAPVQTPPQNRPRLADKLDALGTAPEIEPTRPKRGRPRKDDEPTDEEIETSQARLAELLEEEPPLTGDEPELRVELPDDGWPGPTGPVRHDYEQGKRDAVAGHSDCLNRDIRDIATRYAEWKKGFDSVKKTGRKS